MITFGDIRHPAYQSRKTNPATVSTIGTEIRKAIEVAIGVAITCGGCLVYLRGLDRVTDHDIDTITNGLLAQLALPIDFRKQLGGIAAQRVWLRVIVQRVIVEALGPS